MGPREPLVARPCRRPPMPPRPNKPCSTWTRPPSTAREMTWARSECCCLALRGACMRQGEAPSPCAAPPACPHACLTWRTRPPLLSRSPFSFFRRYRSSIFYHTEAQKAAAEKVRAGPAPRDEADGGEGRGGAGRGEAAAGALHRRGVDRPRSRVCCPTPHSSQAVAAVNEQLAAGTFRLGGKKVRRLGPRPGGLGRATQHLRAPVLPRAAA